MNIALCHFRVGETDGVSLEMEKWKKVLEKMGHNVYLVAGSLGTTDGYVIPELHYRHEVNDKFVRNAYHELTDYKNEEEFKKEVLEFAGKIEEGLTRFVKEYNIDVLVPNNIWSLGWGLPAAIAFDNVSEKLGIKCVAHHHDFYWEREKYSSPTCNFVNEILDNHFPPQHDLVKHVVINKIAQDEMKRRKSLDTTIVPNVFDFNATVWDKDDYNKGFRERIGLKENDIMILQATRIAERKAIELAIDLVGELIKDENIKELCNNLLYDGRKFDADSRIVLVFAGLPESEGKYIELLKKRAEEKNVELLFINDIIEHSRCELEGKKCYSLWDAYVFADLITYPSILEGWGNQFLEGLFAKKPMVVYEYPVYKTDIKEKGFNIVSLGDTHVVDEDGLVKVDEAIIKKAAKECIKLLTDKEYRNNVVEENFDLGKKYFSYESLEKILSGLF
ncbi:glycosyltransferase family 4 protein [Caldisalinibacter kiritimatiensis]|uniref:Glycosyl transferase group 1 n=1 Tax=Caldisalinibacter kiritimatiensis TaxID=1304284 RepID=R1CT38_9FIRM|nr:glycosyltransferase family 4 protein [Caldisalinibacter kiritimatiensis]EOD01811.1 Glycosyl transferase group 1 [Caldisalinibacter kiritimatiensis]